MSYEEDDGWGDEPEDDGPLTVIATFLTLHEAELARGKLQAEGFVAVLWDAGIVGADPLVAVAVQGVKLMVPRRHAARAAAVLSPEVRAFAAEPRPAFRIHSPRGRGAVAVSAVLGLVVAIGLVRAFESPLWLLVGFAVGGLIHWIGSWFRSDYCSHCAAVLPDKDVAACPRCSMILRGTIAHADERLAAEEACES